MAEDEDVLYAAALMEMTERHRTLRRRDLQNMNRLAGTNYERSRELVLYEQANDRELVELIAPQLDTLTSRVVELRRLAGMDRPGDDTDPTGPRTLIGTDGPNPSIEPVTAQPDPDEPQQTDTWPTTVSVFEQKTGDHPSDVRG